MLITKRTPVTVIDLWFPKYSSKYDGTKERAFLPACYKVDNGAEVIIVKFSRAKHMQGLRFAMKRKDVMTYPRQNNGSIYCYAVPESKWEPVETPEDIHGVVENLGWD